ncbi:hypothetical protein Taro_018054 [Colocasia esculenta]|uniref:Uncharacterized protein n=1 Tax=Colocasia esculenta TaxID=4460 RepID=A0A843UHT2_COLES|nr:hypothetical protein [Colocasia esculenta]
MWRSSWWLRSFGTTTRSRSSSPSHLLRPAQTTLLKLTKAPCVNTWQTWSAIQEHALAQAGSGADPVKATARCVTFRGLVATSRHVAT